MAISINMAEHSITITTVNEAGEAVVGFTVYDNHDETLTIYTGACMVCDVKDGLKILHLSKEGKWEKPGD